MAIVPISAVPHRWELAAETIAIKIRWFGILVGYFLVNVGVQDATHQAMLHAILALGVGYTLFDTFYSFRGRVFLGHFPLGISFMESLFIGLLCYFHGGLDSSFRYYYFLSLICCAIRYSSRVTYTTCALHSGSYTLLYFALRAHHRLDAPEQVAHWTLILTLVMLLWVTWASNAMAFLLKQVGDHLGELNAALQENQAQLEARISERTRELQEAQAHLLHQEKMAAFGLLAAGIAHEVGNPLTSISSLVQMLQRRDCDAYTQEKLGLVAGQLQRIQNILRELVNFSRPASTERVRVAVPDILDEALNIAKYYKRTKGRVIETKVPRDLPCLFAVRDQLVQVFLNLVLNAIDATDKGGRIELTVDRQTSTLVVKVEDSGSGIQADNQSRIFQPYFTTKKQGTGLGLFVTRKLVADNGGTIFFESRPGQGTVFWVEFPVATAHSRQEKTSV